MTTITLAPGPTPVMTGVSTLSTPIGFEVHWNTQNINESVNILVSSTAYRANVVMNVTTINSSYVFSSLATGTYYVWVRRLDVNGNYSDWDVADGSGHSVGVIGVLPSNLGTINSGTYNGGKWVQIEQLVGTGYWALSTGFNSTDLSGNSYNTITNTSFSEGVPSIRSNIFTGNGTTTSFDSISTANSMVITSDTWQFTGASANLKLAIEFELTAEPVGELIQSGTFTADVKLQLHVDYAAGGSAIVGTKTFRMVYMPGTTGAYNLTSIQSHLRVTLPPGSHFDDLSPILWQGNSSVPGDKYYLSLVYNPNPLYTASPGQSYTMTDIKRAFIRYSYSQ